MTGLDASQCAVERLYDVVLNDALFDKDKRCNCEAHYGKCLCNFLKERIKRNLRSVLCDMVLLKVLREE